MLQQLIKFSQYTATKMRQKAHYILAVSKVLIAPIFIAQDTIKKLKSSWWIMWRSGNFISHFLYVPLSIWSNRGLKNLEQSILLRLLVPGTNDRSYYKFMQMHRAVGFDTISKKRQTNMYENPMNDMEP